MLGTSLPEPLPISSAWEQIAKCDPKDVSCIKMASLYLQKKAQNWLGLQCVSFQNNTASKYPQWVDKLLMSHMRIISRSLYHVGSSDCWSSNWNCCVSLSVCILSSLPNKQNDYMFVTAWLQARCLENENHGVLKKIVEGSLRLGRLEEKVKVSSVFNLMSIVKCLGFFNDKSS